MKMCKFNPKNDSRRIDPCFKNICAWIEEHTGYEIVASCCGHGKYPPSIVVVRGRVFREIFSDIEIEKPINVKPKFYKKDKKGVYYLPEVSAELK